MTVSDAGQRAGTLLIDLQLWDAVLEQLRSEGFSKTQSIRATVEGLGVPLADAKSIVHHSSVWEDRRQSDEQFHEVLAGTVET